MFRFSQVSIGAACEGEEAASEGGFFFDKSKIRGRWSQMWISFVAGSKGVGAEASGLSLTFRSGANKLFLTSSRGGLSTDPGAVSTRDDGSESNGKSLGVERL